MSSSDDIRSLETSIVIFLSIWNSILFAILLTKLSLSKEEDRYFSLKIPASALLNFGGWALCYALYAATQFYPDTLSATLLWSAYSLLYSISFVSSYVFAISMVYAAFNGSSFQLSRTRLYAHLLLAILLFLLLTLSLLFLRNVLSDVSIRSLSLSSLLGSLTYMLYIGGLMALYYTLNMNLLKMVRAS